MRHTLARWLWNGVGECSISSACGSSRTIFNIIKREATWILTRKILSGPSGFHPYMRPVIPFIAPRGCGPWRQVQDPSLPLLRELSEHFSGICNVAWSFALGAGRVEMYVLRACCVGATCHSPSVSPIGRSLSVAALSQTRRVPIRHSLSFLWVWQFQRVRRQQIAAMF